MPCAFQECRPRWAPRQPHSWQSRPSAVTSSRLEVGAMFNRGRYSPTAGEGAALEGCIAWLLFTDPDARRLHCRTVLVIASASAEISCSVCSGGHSGRGIEVGASCQRFSPSWCSAGVVRAPAVDQHSFGQVHRGCGTPANLVVVAASTATIGSRLVLDVAHVSDTSTGSGTPVRLHCTCLRFRCTVGSSMTSSPRARRRCSVTNRWNSRSYHHERRGGRSWDVGQGEVGGTGGKSQCRS